MGNKTRIYKPTVVIKGAIDKFILSPYNRTVIKALIAQGVAIKIIMEPNNIGSLVTKEAIR